MITSTIGRDGKCESIDSLVSDDAPKRSAAVLHSGRLLLSTFITHRRRLPACLPADIQYLLQRGWLASKHAVYSILRIRPANRASAFSSLLQSSIELITRLSYGENSIHRSIITWYFEYSLAAFHHESSVPSIMIKFSKTFTL